jgi:hypothetical protein
VWRISSNSQISSVFRVFGSGLVEGRRAVGRFVFRVFHGIGSIADSEFVSQRIGARRH